VIFGINGDMILWLKVWWKALENGTGFCSTLTDLHSDHECYGTPGRSKWSVQWWQRLYCLFPASYYLCS
jgi:hypothetical protein